MEDRDYQRSQEIREMRNEKGERIYDQVRKDSASGGWRARRHDDHTQHDILPN